MKGGIKGWMDGGRDLILVIEEGALVSVRRHVSTRPESLSERQLVVVLVHAPILEQIVAQGAHPADYEDGANDDGTQSPSRERRRQLQSARFVLPCRLCMCTQTFGVCVCQTYLHACVHTYCVHILHVYTDRFVRIHIKVPGAGDHRSRRDILTCTRVDIVSFRRDKYRHRSDMEVPGGADHRSSHGRASRQRLGSP